MALITRGMVDGTLLTRGMGVSFFGRIVNYFKDGWYRLTKGRRKLITVYVKANTKIPLAVTYNILSNFSSPYQQVYSIFGNNKNKIRELTNVKGNTRSNYFSIQLKQPERKTSKNSFSNCFSTKTIYNCFDFR